MRWKYLCVQSLLIIAVSLRSEGLAQTLDPNVPRWTNYMRSSVISLIVQREASREFGTGFYVASGFVMTAAHLVTQSESPCDYVARQQGESIQPKAKVLRITGYAGRPDDSGPPLFVIDLSEHPKFVILIQDADLAILRVPDDPHSHPLSLDLEPHPEADNRVSLYGYPLGDKGQDHFGTIEDMLPRYTQDTGSLMWALSLVSEDGESGGPIINANRKVIAVQSCGNNTRQYATPVKVASEKLKTLPVELLGGPIPTACKPAGVPANVAKLGFPLPRSVQIPELVTITHITNNPVCGSRCAAAGTYFGTTPAPLGSECLVHLRDDDYPGAIVPDFGQ